MLGLLLVILGLWLISAREFRDGAGAWIAVPLDLGEIFRLRWTRDQLDHGPSPPRRRDGTRSTEPRQRGLSPARGLRRLLASGSGRAVSRLPRSVSSLA